MKFYCLNCNGLRSATSKGLLESIQKENPDIIAFQEIKALQADIDLKPWEDLGYIPHFFSAEKKGYSGTAIFSRIKPKKVEIGMQHELYDKEGRNILLAFKNFAFVNTYFPSGTTGDIRQEIKMQFLEDFLIKKESWEKEYKKLILCGDVNICHTEIDIHNPKSNQKTSGFLPEEREWVSKYLSTGLIDTFRFLHPGKTDRYSWWSYRAGARQKNKGWRIDYFFITNNLKSKLIYSDILQDVILSDHAPLVLEMDL